MHFKDGMMGKMAMWSVLTSGLAMLALPMAIMNGFKQEQDEKVKKAVKDMFDGIGKKD